MNSRSIPTDWLPQYTYKDYEKWEGNWELIYGFPYAMSPSPKRLHQSAGRKFMRLAEDALSKNNTACDCEVYYELDWIIDESTVIRPDVMIVCGKFEDDFLRFPPTLIIEISSDKTRLKDRNVKFKLYESNGVKFYVLADIEKKSLEVFMLKDNRYQEINNSSFQLTASCAIELNLQKIWEDQ
jgi:Uma2 family endonuclease